MDFKKIIEEYVKYELFIFDINGVLDSLLKTKIKLAKVVFWFKTKKEIAEFLCSLERIYEGNKSAKLQDILQILFKNSKKISKEQCVVFENRYYKENKISNKNIVLLNKLSEFKKVCLYTSLSSNHLNSLFWKLQLSKNIKIYTFESFPETKPSYRNLLHICKENKTKPKDTILFWDNVVVDLMPAKLLWIHTILITPYLDDVINAEIAL